MTKGNLLIVDDETILVKRLKMDLEDLADHIFTAHDGVEALKILNEEKIHCVVCDINMPNMNGVEVLKNLRSHHNDIPFIFFTGHGSHELMLEAAKYGAFDFLDKPFFEGLEDVITRGLKLGFNPLDDSTATEDELMSEYQKLLKNLEK